MENSDQHLVREARYGEDGVWIGYTGWCGAALPIDGQSQGSLVEYVGLHRSRNCGGCLTAIADAVADAKRRRGDE